MLIGLVVLLGRRTTLGTGLTVLLVLLVALLLGLLVLRPIRGAMVAILQRRDVRRGIENRRELADGE